LHERLIKNYGRLLENATKKVDREARKLCLEAAEAAIKAVDPKTVINANVKVVNGILRVKDYTFNLGSFENIYVVGGGKASGFMAEAIEEILSDRIAEGVIVVPKGTKGRYRTQRISIHEGEHPIPGSGSLEGANKIINVVRQAGEGDLVICLISGGGSSLMSLPKEGISLKDKQAITRLLLRCGATINEINTVRKHLSMFKGGQLAREVYPASLISMILSDVVGDPLEVIASGPTVPDPTTYKDAVDVLKRYGIWEDSPPPVREILTEGVSGKIPETPKPGEDVFSRVYNVIVGNNRIASQAAARILRGSGLNTLFLTSFLEGEARDVGTMLAAISREVLASGNPVSKPCGIVLGGETTVTVKGSGVGGRNQEIALSSALKIKGLSGVVILSVSTDGVDGPTDAAGGIVDGSTIARSTKLGMNPVDYLENNDSYTFFSRLGDLVMTGPTGTNVNDISIIVCL